MRGPLILALTGLSVSLKVVDANAQSFAVDRGVWQVGGSASLASSGRASGNRTTSISLAPRLAHFVVPGLAVGATVVLYHVSESGGHSNGYGIGPELTYYFGRAGRRFYPYVGASAQLQWNTQKYTPPFDSTTYTNSYRSQVYEAQAGVACMVARNLALTGAAYYTDRHYHVAAPGTIYLTADNEYGVQFGVSVFAY